MPRRMLAGAALASAVLAAIIVVGTTGRHGHRLEAVFSSATNFRPGLDVRAAGQRVGKVAAVHTDGRTARLSLVISDQRAWPLPKGTRARLRWGGTTTFSSRYVELLPGRGGSDLPDGALIPLAGTVAPVEIDHLLRTFDARGRSDLGHTIDAGGAALAQAAAPLRRVLAVTPPALRQTRGLLADLGDRPQELDSLVRSTDRVVHAVNTANPGIESLLASLAQTFNAVGSEATGLRATLADAPGTLTAARSTLARADGTLGGVRELAGGLAPGIRELRGITPRTNALLRRLTSVAPLAAGTLRDLRRAAPDLVRLLDRAAPLLPRLGSIGRDASRQLRCITPYAPDIAGFASTWGGFIQNGDNVDKYARIHANSLPFPEETTMTSQQVTAAFPALTYAFPRPPGANVGKPKFMGDCGVGRDSVEASKDPEARAGG